MGRKQGRSIRLKPVLFIACEGTSTEYDYFSSWAKTDIALERFEAVNVYPGKEDTNPQTNPHQLYQKAKKALDEEGANIAWIVFDRDGHALLPQTFTNATLAGIKIAFSSRSFEEWVLMHFEKNNTTFLDSECKNTSGRAINCGSNSIPNCTPNNCISGHIRRQEFLDEYSKKRTFDLYKAINNRTEIAMVNSAWLRFQVGASVNTPQPVLDTLNPYTDVDQLLFNFTQEEVKIEWGNANTDIQLNNWVVNAQLVNGNIIVKISHTKPNAQLLNPTFITSLQTTDDDLNNIQCTELSRNYLIDSNESDNNILRVNDVIEFTLNSNNQPYFLFNDVSSSTRIYIVL
jgi:hypothetical protein